MRINFRCLKLAMLVAAFALSLAAQDDPRAVPTPLDPSHQNNAIVASTDRDSSESAMHNSTLAHQNSADEALKKLARETTPVHEFGWNAAATICTILLIGVVLTPFIFKRRPMEHHLDP